MVSDLEPGILSVGTHTQPGNARPEWRAGPLRGLGNDMEQYIDYMPQINPLAIEFLESIVQPDWKVFEYGSGQSTIFFARRVAEMVSVEHDTTWVNWVNEQLTKDGLAIKYLYLPPAPGEGGRDPSDPLSYCHTAHGAANWKPYVSAIDAYPDSYFDLVFVDGGARSSCIWHAHSKIVPGGYLLLDDSERTWYCEKLMHLFNGWQRHDFIDKKGMAQVMSQATFWRRPCV